MNQRAEEAEKELWALWRNKTRRGGKERIEQTLCYVKDAAAKQGEQARQTKRAPKRWASRCKEPLPNRQALHTLKTRGFKARF
ncbi:MAG: hypothetical protein ACLT0Y_07435 [Christensenellales bacterium]